MKLLCVVIVSSLLVVTSCRHEKNKPTILPKEQMESVIWDIMQVDEYANNYLSRDSLRNLDKQRLVLYLKVFQLHHITKDDFNASLKFYSAKPDLMKVIFDSLAVKGEVR